MTEQLSEKQREVFLWWRDKKTGSYDGLICEGAVRSGKTYALSLSFMLWAMTGFDGRRFAICSKTVTALGRNILIGFIPQSQR